MPIIPTPRIPKSAGIRILARTRVTIGPIEREMISPNIAHFIDLTTFCLIPPMGAKSSAIIIFINTAKLEFYIITYSVNNSLIFTFVF